MLINHPGPWQQFQLRPDNRGLSVMEIKSKYLHEQYLFEAQMNTLNQIHQQNTFMNGGGGGPAPISTPSEPVIPDNLIQFYFTSIQDAINEFGDVTSLTTWNGGNIFDKTDFTYISVDTDNITIGNTTGDVSLIEDGDFSGSTSLTRIIDINSNTIISLGNNSLASSGLISIQADYVTSIGSRALSVCTNLSEITFRADGCTYGTDVFLNSAENGIANVNTDATLDANIVYLQTILNWTIVS